MATEATENSSRGLSSHRDARLLEGKHLDQGKAIKRFLGVVNKATSCLDTVSQTHPEILVVGPDTHSLLTDTEEDWMLGRIPAWRTKRDRMPA